MPVRITSLEEAPKQGIEFELTPESHLVVLPELNDFPESAVAGVAAFLTERYFFGRWPSRQPLDRKNFSRELEFRRKVELLTGGEVSYMTKIFYQFSGDIYNEDEFRSFVDVDVIDLNAGFDLPSNSTTIKVPKLEPTISGQPSSKKVTLESGILEMLYHKKSLSEPLAKYKRPRTETRFTIKDDADRPLNGYIFEAK